MAEGEKRVTEKIKKWESELWYHYWGQANCQRMGICLIQVSKLDIHTNRFAE